MHSNVLTLPQSLSPASPIRARAFVFEDPSSRRLHERIERIAPSDVPVLISGETGTGKELVARRIHALSRRADKPFVAINIGAFSETLIESELFGHEKGAFTGALAAKAGYFETAHGGTLFLDEVGELALPLQVKLLRVLQERQVARIGARTTIDVDVRLIAATNVDLQAAMRAKHFREDLYYRLRVSPLQLPALRDRPGDILPLARHFMEVYARKLGRAEVRLSPSAAECLLQHAWPGNIRELENTIHHALVVSDGEELTRGDLELGAPLLSGIETVVSSPAPRAGGELERLRALFAELIAQREPDLHARVEAALYSAAFSAARQNQLETARLLGVSRNVVRARLIEQGTLQGPLRRTAPSSRPAERVVRIGYQKLGLMTLLKHAGLLDDALRPLGMRAQWIEYEGGIQIVGALKAGALDVACVGNGPAVVAQAERVPIVYVAAEPPAPRAAGLLVPAESTVRAVGELRGRRVVVNRGAQAHYLLMCALEEAGLASDSVDVRFEPPERALAAFRAGAVEAWAIWDPFLSDARIELGARLLRDATGLAKNSTYYVAERGFARENADVLRTLWYQLGEVARFDREQREHAAARMAPQLGFTQRALLASWQRELQPVPVDAELLAAQQDVANTLYRLQVIAQRVNVSDAAWDLRLAG